MRHQLYLDPISRNQPYKISLPFTHQVGPHHLARIQHNLENRVRPFLDHRRRYGLVRTHGPFSVTAIQCSKWAE